MTTIDSKKLADLSAIEPSEANREAGSDAADAKVGWPRDAAEVNGWDEA